MDVDVFNGVRRLCLAWLVDRGGQKKGVVQRGNIIGTSRLQIGMSRGAVGTSQEFVGTSPHEHLLLSQGANLSGIHATAG